MQDSNQKIIAGRVRAVIVKDNKIILIKRVKSNETYWVFPGGGIEPGETKEVALLREISEALFGIFDKNSQSFSSVKS